MPIKKNPNSIGIRDTNSSVLSFFTFSKKSHFDSESKLFDAVKLAVSGVSPYFNCHLTTYPHIAIHVEFGKADELNRDKDRLKEVIQKTLESQLKP